MEGRAFILGRNGLYNKAIELLQKNKINQIYFVFLFKNESEIEMKTIIDNLYEKGDQKELKNFKKNNQIIYLNEDILSIKEIDKLYFYLTNLLISNYFCLNKFVNKEGKNLFENFNSEFELEFKNLWKKYEKENFYFAGSLSFFKVKDYIAENEEEINSKIIENIKSISKEAVLNNKNNKVCNIL